MQGTFSIAEPCHENWETMSQAQKGKFCDVCAKCVHDFTQKSQAEILAVYQENKGNVCGRVRPSQLAMPLPGKKVMQTKSFLSRNMSRLRTFAAACFLAFGFMFTQQAHAQIDMKMGKMAYHAEGKIVGTVINPDGDPATGVKVVITDDEGDQSVTKTDNKGFYKFENISTGTYFVEAIHKNYEAYESGVEVNDRNTSRVDLHLREETMMMMGEMILPEVILIPEEPAIEEIAIEKSGESGTFYANDEFATEPGLQVFPNPTSGKTFVSVNLFSEEEMSLTVTNISGLIVLNKNLGKSSKVMQNLDLSGIPAGIYFVRVVAGEKLLEKKIVRL